MLAFIDWSIHTMKIWKLLSVFCVLFFILSGCVKRESSTILEPVEDVEDASTIIEVASNEQPISKLGVVPLIDPRTLEIVQTIIPKELGYNTDLTLYETHLKQIAKELARGTESFSGYDQTMELDRIDESGQIIKGTPGVILKESELVAKILEASETGGDVHLPLYEKVSNYEIDDITNLNDAVVASYTTYFQSSEKGRSKNIELSAHALNNIILGVDDYFSFNTMVGERTKEKGYQPAYEIVNKQLVLGIGGGICQTSSTLFNAIDQVAVRITERHHHSLSVGYVPKGRDATVSYSTLDFKFQNTSGVPLLIKTYFGAGTLTIELRTASYYKTILENV